MRVQHAHYTSAPITLSPASQACLSRRKEPVPDSNGDIAPVYRSSGVARNGALAWIARGPALEVFVSATGARRAAWCFGAAIKEPSVNISAICEYPWSIGSSSKSKSSTSCSYLLVGTTVANSDAGMLCLFDVKASKVVKAIDIPFMVTSIEPISGPNSSMSPLLSEHLRCFCGIVAVGTHCGHVYLIDMCLDQTVDDEDDDEDCVSDELCPAPLQMLEPRSRDTARQRHNALHRGKHLALELGEESHSRGYYYYRKPDSSVVRTYSADEVCVSALCLLPHTGMLAVGLHFGCWQLWRLGVPVLEYSSRLESDDLPPVTHFSFQEPENDPRNFCYVWVARGPMQTDRVQDYVGSITLFQLGYARKVWVKDLGYHFEELTSVGPRFELELNSEPGSGRESLGSRLLTCHTISKPNFKYEKAMTRKDDQDSFEEGNSAPDLSRCVFVWEAVCGEGGRDTAYFLAIFDMNRWYHAQMPVALRFGGGPLHDQCTFMSFCSLDRIHDTCHPDELLACHIPYSSVCRFVSSAIPEPEQHFFPSALAFDLCVTTGRGIIHAKYLGFQRQVLSELRSLGPGCLVDPTDIFHLFLSAGLLPRTTVLAEPAVALTASQKREAILSSALEHNMLNFIKACSKRWASGDLSNTGCSLRFLLEWAWTKVTVIKEILDKLCVSLYDWSGVGLTLQDENLLHHQQLCLNYLVSVFNSLRTQAAPTTQAGLQELELREEVVTLIAKHYALVLWFYGAGLLPENPEGENTPEDQYAFPTAKLNEFYSKRRSDIEHLHRGVKSSDVLLIDGLVEQLGPLENTWGNDHYPPASFKSLLNIYLLKGASLDVKHMLSLYVLCDIYSLLPEHRQPMFSEKLGGFAASFAVPAPIKKLVQGLWLVDHGDFEDSLAFLLDPNVPCVSSWQHRRVLKAFLYQGAPRLALKYLRMKRPPVETPDDTKLILTVLLANGLVSEAFAYQRQCKGEYTDDFLQHIFLGCQQTKSMGSLLQLPLYPSEERHLADYLQDAGEREVLLMYYLQRARIVPAIRLNKAINAFHDTSMLDEKKESEEQALTRNSLVDGYQKVLPSVQRALALTPDILNAQTAVVTQRHIVQCPQPLSAVVKRTLWRAPLTKATLLRNVMDRVSELKPDSGRQQEQEEAAGKDRHMGMDFEEQNEDDEVEEEEVAEEPFVCTPITPRTRQRRSMAVYESAVNSPLLSPPRKRPYEAISTPTPLKAEISRLQEKLHGMQRNRESMMSASNVLALLVTPPVKRCTPQTRRSIASPALPHVKTPPSILKPARRRSSSSSALKGALRRSPSPARTTAFNKTATAAAGNTSQVSAYPTPRLNVRKSIHIVDQPTVLTSPAPVTPKQIRFSEPAEEEEEEQVPPEPLLNPRVALLKSSRDRSPTPQRKSPLKTPPTNLFRPSISSGAERLARPSISSVQEKLEDEDMSEEEEGEDVKEDLKEQGADKEAEEIKLVVDDDITFSVKKPLVQFFQEDVKVISDSAAVVSSSTKDIEEGQEDVMEEEHIDLRLEDSEEETIKELSDQESIQTEDSQDLVETSQAEKDVEMEEVEGSDDDVEVGDRNVTAIEQRVTESKVVIESTQTVISSTISSSSDPSGDVLGHARIKIASSSDPSGDVLGHARIKIGVSHTSLAAEFDDRGSSARSTRSVSSDESIKIAIESSCSEPEVMDTEDVEKISESQSVESFKLDGLETSSERSRSVTPMPEDPKEKEISPDKGLPQVPSFKDISGLETPSQRSRSVTPMPEDNKEVEEKTGLLKVPSFRDVSGLETPSQRSRSVTPMPDKNEDGFRPTVSTDSARETTIVEEDDDLERRSRSVTPMPDEKDDTFKIADAMEKVEEEVERSPSPPRRVTRAMTPSRDEADSKEAPVTPSRRSTRRTPSREVPEPTTPTRRTTRSSTTPSRDDEDISKTPTRRSTRSVSKDQGDDIEKPTTPSRRSTRSTTPSRDEPDVKAAPVTPSRRSTQSSTPARDEVEEAMEQPLTPTRRVTRSMTPSREEPEGTSRPATPTRSRKSSVSSQAQEEADLKEVSRATTPTRRSTRATTPSRDDDIEKALPKTPTRRSTRATTPSREDEHEPKEASRATTPTRRSSRASTPSRDDVVEKALPKTPTRRSTRVTTPSRDDDIEKALPKTPTRRSSRLSSHTDADHEPKSVTPTRRKTRTTPLKDVESTEVRARTPTRRSLRGATAEAEGEEGAVRASPRRRGGATGASPARKLRSVQEEGGERKTPKKGQGKKVDMAQSPPRPTRVTTSPPHCSPSVTMEVAMEIKRSPRAKEVMQSTEEEEEEEDVSMQEGEDDKESTASQQEQQQERWEVESTASEPMEFCFSPPVRLTDHGDKEEGFASSRAGGDVPSFIFSPPLTRSRRQSLRSSAPPSPLSTPVKPILPQIAEVDTRKSDEALSAAVRSPAKHGTKKTRTIPSHSDSPLNEDIVKLVSPVAAPSSHSEATTSPTATRQQQKTRKTSTKSTLRSRRVTRKRQPLQW